MSRRTWRIALAIAAVVLLLFVGREVTTLLAERWWAAQVSFPAADFLTRRRLLALFLEGAGILVASAWFTGNYLFVYRTVGSVQVPRTVANLEIREALTPRALVMGTLGAGILLGVMTGAGGAGWWDDALLAWHGVSWGVTEPLLGNDIGRYVAQLPLWRELHSFAFLLILLGLSTVLLLYALIGALRWQRGHPAISDHARRHLGWLLAAFALTLAWGYALESPEIVAGLKGGVGGGADLRFLIARILTGTALAAAMIAAVWAWQPRHTLLVAGWIVLMFASLTGHYILPALRTDVVQPALTQEERRTYESLAYSLAGVVDTTFRGDGGVAPPRHPALWHPSAVASLAGADSGSVLALNPGELRVGGRRLPVWFLLRDHPSGNPTLVAIADDRTSVRGLPLTYQPGDSVPYPGLRGFLSLSPSVIRPLAPAYRIGSDDRGVRIGGPVRRLVLAWARQAGELLGRTTPNAHLEWHLGPGERLAAIAPWVTWDSPTLHMVDGDVTWVATGYLTTRTFPLVDRMPWQGRRVASVHPAVTGVISAESGETHLYLRRNADPLALAWSDITGGVVEPASAMPRSVEDVLPYPNALFDVQAQLMERDHWVDGRRVGTGSSTGRDVRVGDRAWGPDAGERRVAAYEDPGERRLTSVVEARMRDGRQVVTITRLTVAGSVSSPAVLDRRWRRFPTYEQLRDSLRVAGARLDDGPVQVWIDGTGAGAYRSEFAAGPEGTVHLVWMSLALGDRMGAGHGPEEAWRNLEGVTVPILPGGPTREIEEARRYMARADSALRRGDWIGFARAFEGLREVLDLARPDDSVPPPTPPK